MSRLKPLLLLLLLCCRFDALRWPGVVVVTVVVVIKVVKLMVVAKTSVVPARLGLKAVGKARLFAASAFQN